ncbi:glutathione S-transferase family protein [Myxococcota bacterium]|nr:glutathione S-transferase family protein [Myxococcota bacterium]
MIVYGVKFSPFVLKVLVALEEKGLAYSIEPPAPALHPLGKMPVLRDGDAVVQDSSVICGYLERKFPSPPLYPEDPVDLARALFLEEYGDAGMAEGWGEVVFERIVKPQMLGQPTDEARLAVLQQAVRERWAGSPRSAGGHPIPAIFDHLESQIPENRDTLLPQFGIADVAVGAHFGWLEAGGLEIDAKRWPRVARYAAAIRRRPSFGRLLA